MTRPRRPKDETKRLATLRSAPLAGVKAGPTFDEVTRLARELFSTEMAALSVVEDQHQVFAAGLDAPVETRRDASFCAHTIGRDEVLAVPDAAADARFADAPLVVHDASVRFYAGAPLSTRNGSRVGALCVLGHEPREVVPADLDALRDLGRALEREIQRFEAASFDALTGLTNRSGLLTLGEEMLAISRSADEGAAVLFIDLEGVRPINERFGEKAGDQALCDLARILEGNFRGSDLVARLGGDEFCVLMAPYTDETENFAVTNRVQAAIDRYNETAGVPWSLHVNIGGARYQPGMGLDRMLSLADARMIEARNRRRALRG